MELQTPSLPPKMKMFLFPSVSVQSLTLVIIVAPSTKGLKELAPSWSTSSGINFLRSIKVSSLVSSIRAQSCIKNSEKYLNKVNRLLKGASNFEFASKYQNCSVECFSTSAANVPKGCLFWLNRVRWEASECLLPISSSLQQPNKRGRTWDLLNIQWAP